MSEDAARKMARQRLLDRERDLQDALIGAEIMAVRLQRPLDADGKARREAELVTIAYQLSAEAWGLEGPLS